MIGGLVAGQVFQQVWKHATPGDNADAPKALESEYRSREILIAAAIQGAIFAVVRKMSRTNLGSYQDSKHLHIHVHSGPTRDGR